MLVDEVLAVGDSEFQGKCLAKIRETVRSGMRAIGGRRRADTTA
jgi:ABC-type polysaccharide/polyol phosphate transport system ATPase subunit